MLYEVITGLPYIRRDGEINPERNNTDRPQLSGLIDNVRALTLAWYFSGKNAYAEKAAELLRVWFLDEETLMNRITSYNVCYTKLLRFTFPGLSRRMPLTIG